jgi:uncharacterized OsmC-like protein
MDSEKLASLQKPLKESYKEDGSKAFLTLKAEGQLENQSITCSVQTGKALVEAGLHEKTGGDGTFACSGDMLLQSLVACAGDTFMAVATAFNVQVKKGVVRAEGDLDFRGTLGVSKEAPVGFQTVRLFFDVDTDADNEKLAKVLQVTERYCVVLQTLKNPPKFETSVHKTQ